MSRNRDFENQDMGASTGSGGATGGSAAGGRTSSGAAAATTAGAGGQGESGGAFGGVADQTARGVNAPSAGGAGATGSITDQAKQTTGEVVGQVQQQAATRLDQQKETAVSGLTSVAGAVRQIGSHLRGQEQGQGAIAQYAAQYGDKAADQIERLTSYLRERDTTQLVRDVESLARRQPALFLGGAFLLGLAGARFLKSSRPAQLPGTPPDASRALPPATYPPATTPTAGAGTTGGAGGMGQTPNRSTSIG